MNENTGNSFFQRWARRKAESSHVDAMSRRAPLQAALPIADTASPVLPTLADVGLLTPQSDYAQYLTAHLDKSVHRAAMKKLFSDPHFNRMDGLDIYIGDYTIPSPVSAAMLAGLAHAKSTLWPQPAWRTDPVIETHVGEPGIPIDGDTEITPALAANDALAGDTDGPMVSASEDPAGTGTGIGTGTGMDDLNSGVSEVTFAPDVHPGHPSHAG